MNYRKLLPLLAVPVLAAGVFIYTKASASGTSASPVFKTAVAKRGDIVQSVSASGPLSAVSTVEVGSQVSGIIAKLYVDFNDTVKEGQVIAEIDPSTYEAKRVQADGDLASAKATLELKQLNFKRTAELFERKLVSESDYDQARVELRQQEATVKNKEATLKSALVDLERCTIKSPINGVVIERSVDAGQTVQASFSAPTLFTLAQDLREMQITANVSEADIGGVEAGQSVAFTVDAFTGRTFNGTVRQVRNNPTTTNNVVNYYTIINVKNQDLKLRPGMTANVTITTAKRSNVVRVPNSALRVRLPDNTLIAPPPADMAPPSSEDNQAQATAQDNKPAGSNARPGKPSAGAAPKMVYILDGKPDSAGRATGQVTPVPVSTGLSDSAFTEVSSGLSENALIITGTSSTAVGTTTTSSTSSSADQTTNPFAPKPPPGAPRR